MTPEEIAQLCVRVVQQMNAASAVPNKVNKFDNFDANRETFSLYIDRFENYCARHKLTVETDHEGKERTKLLLDSLSTENYNLLTSLTAPDPITSKSYKQIVEILSAHLDPPPNVILEQHKFFSVVQSSSETINSFVARLKTQSILCKFKCPHTNCKKSVAELLLRSQFIRGIYDTDIREKLIQLGADYSDTPLSFEKIVSHALSIESTKTGNKEMSKNIISSSKENKENQSVFAVAKFKSSQHQGKFPSTQRRFQSHSRFSPRFSSQNRFYNNNKYTFRNKYKPNENLYRKLGIEKLCIHCGRNNHKTNECKIDRNLLKCTSCNKNGHVAKVCIVTLTKKSSSRNNFSNGKSIANIDTLESLQEGDTCDLDYSVNEIVDVNSNIKDGDKYLVSVTVSGVPSSIKFEVDSGSKATLLPESLFYELGIGCPLEPTRVKFRCYTQNLFSPLGVAHVTVVYKNCSANLQMFIVSDAYQPVLGVPWIRNLGINLQEIDQGKGVIDIRSTEVNAIKMEEETRPYLDEIFRNYAGLFEPKIGIIPNITVSLNLCDNIKPIFLKARPIPYALKEKVEEELDRLEAAEIISKVDYSDWGSPAVILPKPDGGVRICCDYKPTVNPQLSKANYPIPDIDSILHNLHSGKIFCNLDIFRAYLHLKVDAESAKIQTLTTHRGTYAVNRLSFGIKSAPNEFQKVIDQILSGLEGVIAYYDDIIVFGESMEQCHKRLKDCLNRLKSNNLHLNKTKCNFFQKSIKYLGHIISNGQIRKAPDRVLAVLQAPRPQSVEDVRTFLGLITYYCKFIPKSSEITHPLRSLLQKNCQFSWSQECEKAFQMLKNEIASDRVLVPYKPALPLCLACDASPKGLSGVLSHIIDGEERPIAFASRSLTSAERHYSQLDKEATAIYWSLNKFYKYIYGRHFTLVTDNRPLSYIFKHDAKTPTVTSSRLLRYAIFLSGFDYKISHKRSEQNANADYFSRAPLPAVGNTEDEDEVISTATVHNITTNSITREDIVKATNEDPELRKLHDKLLSGEEVDPQFSLHRGIVMRGARIFIPESLRPEILTELHQTHLGIVKMKALARRFVYWRNIDVEIESLVKACPSCAQIKKDPPKVSLHLWEEPVENFQRIHIDYAGPVQGTYFLVVVDAKSKWPEIVESRMDPTSESTIEILSSLFTQHGLPEIIVSDNATIFKSIKFDSFCKNLGIRQKFTPPGHPATNGLAERYVQILKGKLKAMENETGTLKQKINKILYYFRVTPLKTGKSPSEMYLNRQIRHKFDLLKLGPELKHEEEKQQKCSQQQNKIRHFREGERVQVRVYQQAQNWKYGCIYRKLGNVTYLVKLDHGFILKRHVNQLRYCEVDQHQQDEEIPANRREMTRILPRGSQAVLQRPQPIEGQTEGMQPSQALLPPSRPQREHRVPSRFKDCVRY